MRKNILILSCCIFVVLVVYFSFQKFIVASPQLKTVKVPDSLVINATTTQVATTSIKVWKTYSNEKYGFTFQYPSTLEMWNNLDTTELGTDPSIRLIYTIDENNNFQGLRIGVSPNPKRLSAEELINQQIADGRKCEEVCGSFSRFSGKNQIQSGDNTFYGITGGFTGEVPEVDIYYLSSGDKLFDFELPNYSGAEKYYPTETAVSKEMYKILDTFQFTR